MEKITQELENDINKRKRLGFSNYWTSNSLLMVAVVCSLFPLVNEAIPAEYRLSQIWIRLISAIPAAVIFVLTTFKFEEKQNYHWRYARQIRALYRKLRDQGADAALVSQEYSNLTIELGEKYPGNKIVSGFRGRQDEPTG